MATVPTGNPAWSRATGITYYGGHASKVNYQGLPIVNPKTDVGAEHILRMAADLSAVTRMANFATLNITMASGSDSPTVNECRMMTGVYAGSGYTGSAPPTGFPRVVGVQDGVVDIKFSGAYSDPYSVAATFQPTFAGGNIMVYGASVTGATVHAMTSGTDTVRVRVETSSGSGVTGNSVSVWTA